jgi:hypothetical protein
LVGLLAVISLFGVAAKFGAQDIDLHKVNWTNTTLPGSVCGSSQPIQLHERQAVIRSARWPKAPVHVYAGVTPVVYGDLDRDGTDEAALYVDCNNGSGTAAGVLAYAQIIFTAGPRTPHAIAVITPRQQNPRQSATLVHVTIRPGKVIAHESWYGPHDGTCCPTGRATTVWTYAYGTLIPSSTVVTKRPAHS